MARSFLGLLLALVPCFISLQAFAADREASEQFAEQLGFYKDIQELKVDFHQVKTLKKLGLELKSEGSLHLNRPADLEWLISKPARLLVKMHGDELTIESGSGTTASTERIKIGDIAGDNAAKGIAPLLSWLQLDVGALKKQYNITSTAPRAFQLEPLDAKAPLSGIEAVTAKTGYLEQLILREKSGDSIAIRFESPRVLRRAEKLK